MVLDQIEKIRFQSSDTGNRGNKATALGNLGVCYATLGQTSTAIDHLQQALAIFRDIGDRGGEAATLGNLGDCYTDLEQFPTAIEHYSIAIKIADEVGYAQIQCEARVSLAQAYLFTGDFDVCRATAKNVLAYYYPPARAQAHLLLGIAQLLQGKHLQAQQRFTTTVEHADAQLQHSTGNYASIECKALALCGFVLTNQLDQLPDAITLSNAAHKITSAPGIVARTLRLFDAIAAKDISRFLTIARSAAQGEPGVTQIGE